MPEQALNADDVARAALALLDDVGLRGFTMRALADRLGTYPATIYWHVGRRTEVLSAANALVLHEAWADLPDPALDWQQWLIDAARAHRRAMRAHPALASFGVTHFEARVPVPEYLEKIMVALSHAGFRDAQLVDAYNAYVGTIVGWVGLEMIAEDPELGADPEPMERSVRELSPDDYPTIIAHLDHLADGAFGFRWHGGATNPLDSAFEFVLATLVDGLRGRLRNDP